MSAWLPAAAAAPEAPAAAAAAAAAEGGGGASRNEKRPAEDSALPARNFKRRAQSSPRAIDYAHFAPSPELTHIIPVQVGASSSDLVVKLLTNASGKKSIHFLFGPGGSVADHELHYKELGEGSYGKVYVFDETEALGRICVKVMFPHYDSFADMETGGKDDSDNVDAFLTSPEYSGDAKGIYPHPFFNSYKDKMWVQVMERLEPLKRAPASPAYRKCLAEFGLHTFRYKKASIDNKVWNFAKRLDSTPGRKQYVRIDLPATTQGTFPFEWDVIMNSHPLRQTNADPYYFHLRTHPNGNWRWSQRGLTALRRCSMQCTPTIFPGAESENS